MNNKKLMEMYEQVLAENKELKIKNIELQSKLMLYEAKELELSVDFKDENTAPVRARLNEITDTNSQKDELIRVKAELEAHKINFKEYMKIVTCLFGYRIEMHGNNVEILSIYAFDSEDVFIFTRTGSELQLNMNSFAGECSEDLNRYLREGKSLPAFLSSVTLGLYSKNTYGA